MSTTALEHLNQYIDVEDLMNRCLYNVDFATRIIGVLNDRCEKDLSELERALSEADTERIAEVSHRLKGALANSAAYSLSKRADQLRSSAILRSTADISTHLAELRREWDEVASLIKSSSTLKP